MLGRGYRVGLPLRDGGDRGNGTDLRRRAHWSYRGVGRWGLEGVNWFGGRFVAMGLGGTIIDIS